MSCRKRDRESDEAEEAHSRYEACCAAILRRSGFLTDREFIQHWLEAQSVKGQCDETAVSSSDRFPDAEVGALQRWLDNVKAPGSRETASCKAAVDRFLREVHLLIQQLLQPLQEAELPVLVRKDGGSPLLLLCLIVECLAGEAQRFYKKSEENIWVTGGACMRRRREIPRVTWSVCGVVPEETLEACR